MDPSGENGNSGDIGARATPSTTTAAAPARADSIRTGGTNPAPPRHERVPLGAELPIFCERCGYSLNALPQITCEHCSLLQFHCPECGHHQPINTLRPAMQRTLGRLRAWLVGAIAFIKLNWFGWHFFFWIVMGHEWAYTWDRASGNQRALDLDLETGLAFGLYATIIGLLSRLMLLRWRSGALVGVVLASIYCTALMLGFNWRVSTRGMYGQYGGEAGLLTVGRMVMVFYTFIVITVAAVAAWPIWVGFVRVAMPERAGSALLEWQRSLADRMPKARLSDQP